MSGVGVVLYTKGEEPGSLNAKWCYSDYGCGTGIATGGPMEGFEGNYTIRYFDSSGNFQAERGLKIQKTGIFYQVTWMNKDEISGSGVGMETEEGLSVGYRDLNSK